MSLLLAVVMSSPPLGPAAWSMPNVTISTGMAQAFLDKGARAFVSWSRPVSAVHTDTTTERLLEDLLLDGFTTGRAVTQTSAEMGSDPLYGAELRFLKE